MGGLWIPLGALVISLVVADALTTTLWPDGRAGRLTQGVGRSVWGALKIASGGRRDRLLSLAGPLTLVATATAWVWLVAAGWVMVFQTDGWLEYTRGPGEGDLPGKIWFVFYTMHTVGNGDFTPSTDGAEIAASLTAFSGMVMITLAVTYVLSVVNAVTQRRAFATSVSSLGTSGEDIVIRAWDGAGFTGLSGQLAQLGSQLGAMEERHRAYPIVFFFHPARKDNSLAAALAILDDALVILAHGVREDVRPRPAEVAPVQRSVASYAEMLQAGTISDTEEPAPRPGLGAVRRAGVPCVEDAELARRLDRHERRRRALLAFARHDAWRWSSVAGGGAET